MGSQMAQNEIAKGKHPRTAGLGSGAGPGSSTSAASVAASVFQNSRFTANTANGGNRTQKAGLRRKHLDVGDRIRLQAAKLASQNGCRTKFFRNIPEHERHLTLLSDPLGFADSNQDKMSGPATTSTQYNDMKIIKDIDLYLLQKMENSRRGSSIHSPKSSGVSTSAQPRGAFLEQIFVNHNAEQHDSKAFADGLASDQKSLG